MSSQFLFGTYRTYKLGTEKVLNWLYENAVKCGYGVNADAAPADDDAPVRKKKPKPKAKKGQGSKAKGSGKAKKKADSTQQTKAVAVREFTLLAEAIASSEKKIKVPQWVISMVEEVISARKKSARWFSQQAGDTTSRNFDESNDGHQYFIEILERVLELLQSCQKSGKEAAVKADGVDPLAHITNLFEVLELEDIAEDTESTLTESTPSASTPKTPTPEVVYDEEPSTEEVVWLLYCFFEDFNVARELLRDMWTTYKSGNMNLTAVALATNTAFVMFQRAEAELMAELKLIIPEDLQSQIVGCKEILYFLVEIVMIKRGLEPPKDLHPLYFYGPQLFGIADWTCFTVYQNVAGFLAAVKPGGVPICTPGHFGKLNLRDDVLTTQEKFVQDRIVLLERLLPEFVFLARLKDPQTRKSVQLPGQDELTKGVLSMIRTKETPLWLMLALQLQLDIHYILLTDTSRPFAELSAFATGTVYTLKEYLEFSKDMQVATWPKSNEKLLESIIYDCKMWIDQDFLDPIRTIYHQDVELAKQGGDFVLLKRHPLLCGMLLFRLTVMKHDLGLTVANAWGAVPSILHLYNAALFQGILVRPWMDMEALIIANSAERIFIGGRPDKSQEYIKRFMLALGISATTYAANRRSNDMRLSRKGPRQMLASPAIANIYANRYKEYAIGRGPAQDQSHPEFTLNAIEQLLLASAQDADSDHESGALKVNIQSGQRGLAQKFAKSHKLTTTQLLTALATGTEEEGFALNVDYFSLHMRCYQLLRTIYTDMNDSLTRSVGPIHMDKESELPGHLVGVILQFVADSSNGGERSLNAGMLLELGRLVSRFINDLPDKGSEEIEKVKKVCCTFRGVELEYERISR